MNDVLFIVAAVLLAVGLGIKLYGMAQLANKKLPEAERMARYKKTVPVTYLLLVPTILIIVFLIATK